MSVIIGNKEFFKGIGQVKYEGVGSDNPLAYRWALTARPTGSTAALSNALIVNPTYVEYTVTWRSLVDKRFVVDSTLPTW